MWRASNGENFAAVEWVSKRCRARTFPHLACQPMAYHSAASRETAPTACAALPHCKIGCLPEKFPMPFVDVSKLPVAERLPGWYGRYFHSPTMTFAHYDFVRGSSIHEHFHPQEEVYEVIEGELEVTIDGVAQIARAGLVAIVPAGVRHSVKALTDGRAIIVDYPMRPEYH